MITRRNLNWMVPAVWLGPRCSGASDANSLLEQVTRRYQELKSYRFEGKTVSESTVNRQVSKSETGFTAAFEAPDKFVLEFRYATAGKWLRVSDGKFLLERRTITNESKRTPVTGREMIMLKSSPLYNFEQLSQTAIKPMLVQAGFIEVDGKKIECDAVQFEAGRRMLREGESAGRSMVWISRADRLILKEEIRTNAKFGNNVTETLRTTFIEHFSVDQPLPAAVFDTQAE